MFVKNQNCIYCNAKAEKFPLFRHIFIKCSVCKTIQRSEEKKINIFSLFKKTYLWKRLNFDKNKYNQFNYYLDDNILKNYKNEKYFFIKNFLNKTNDIKDILDISGGPGSVGYYLKKNFNLNYDLTEYTFEIVENIKKKLNLNCYYLDFDKFQENNLPENKKYDLIIFYQSIYYLRDINILLKFLNTKLRNNGKVIIVSNKPNFATMCKFSIMENYPPYVFYSKTLLSRFFFQNGFVLKRSDEVPVGNFIKHYFFKFSGLRKFLFSFFCCTISMYYILINLLKLRPGDLIMSNYQFVFEKKE